MPSRTQKSSKSEAVRIATDRVLLCECVIPGKPVSVNRVWRSARGRTYKADNAREFESRGVAIIREARRISGYEGACALEMEIWRRTRHRYDLDNCIKQVQDCVQRSGVIKDDSQIVDLHAVKRWGDREYVRVRLFTVEEGDG